VTQPRTFFGHPGGLSTLFMTEMWERFSYYGIRGLLVLYMSAALADGGFGFDRTEASAIYGIYAASVYLASLPGGWIADRWLGLQRAVFIGGVLIALGHLAIGLSAAFEQQAFFLGLVLIVFGTGLLKGNVSALVGGLYPEGGARQDAGFSIFYMGINTGAFIAPLITGFLGEKIGWHWGFGAAGLGMLIGLFVFRAQVGPRLGENGRLPSGTPEEQRQARTIGLSGFGIAFLVVILAMVGVFKPNPVAIAGNMSTVMLTMSALYFAYLFFVADLTTDEKKRVGVIMVLFVFSMIFWGAFEQAPTSLNLFAKDFTDRTIFGWEMPVSWLQALNSLFVILFAPVLAVVWERMGARGKNPSSPAKFAFALLAAGLGFWLMVSAANDIAASGGTLKVSAWWLTASYFLQSIGELCLSPVGLSSMILLAPKRFVGQMMGVWFTSIALGNLFAGIVGGNVDPTDLSATPELFRRTAYSLFLAAAVLALLVVPIRRMMADKRTRG
jgi:POT family proton-dependent oligopeptide transporter